MQSRALGAGTASAGTVLMAFGTLDCEREIPGKVSQSQKLVWQASALELKLAKVIKISEQEIGVPILFLCEEHQPLVF